MLSAALGAWTNLLIGWENAHKGGNQSLQPPIIFAGGYSAERGYPARCFTPGGGEPRSPFSISKSSNLKPCPSHCLSLLLKCAAVRDHVLEPCSLSSQLNQVYNQTADVLMCRPMLWWVGQVVGFSWLLLDLVLVKLPCHRVSRCSWKWRMVHMKFNMPQVQNHAFEC